MMSADVRRDAFNNLVKIEAAALIELVSRRNRSYAEGDPLKCWRKRGLLGLLVRLEDKFHRFDTFVENGGATEEQWRELLQDIAGYALCGLVWLGRGEDQHVKDEGHPPEADK